MKKLFLLVLLAMGFIFTGMVAYKKQLPRSIASPIDNNYSQPTLTLVPTLLPTTTPTPIIIKKEKILIENVPFTPQSPFAQWKDPRQQDACEEAAVLMAVYWAESKTLDQAQALEQILKMSAYQTDKYGEYRDTKASDTAERLMKGYFDYSKYQVKEFVTTQDIKDELIRGNLVIVPANGQALNNPHFTPPGPERHNLVIRGYDDTKNIFITNDPGIKEGELYSYPQGVLLGAVRDYPTGYHLPITEINKVMIIISK